MAKLPLEGLRVIEVGVAWAVPMATKILGDMGAEVIKVESTTRLDLARGLMYPDHQMPERFWDDNGVYVTTNVNKLGLTLNLATARGQELFKELVKQSDIVAENFQQEVLSSFGLSYEELRKVKPDIIMLSSTGYGHSGPWVKYRSMGVGLEPMCGICFLTGYADGPPMQSAIPYPDVPSALNAVTALLAALEHRRRTGEGQWIEMAQYEVGTAIIGDAILDYTANGRIQGRIGNRHPSMAPHGVYRCNGSDNWVAIAVANDEEWRALCTAMGQPALAEDERFRDNLARLEHQDELNPIIEDWTKPQDHYEVMHLLQKVGVAAGAVLNCKELLLDPHLRARDNFPMVRHSSSTVGVRAQLGPWFRLSETPGGIRRSAPTLGEHNAEILSGLLNLGSAELEGLQEEGIIGTEPKSVDRSMFVIAPLPVMKQLGIVEDFDANYKEVLGIE